MSEAFQFPELNDTLIEILGRPNFQCSHLANALRLNGHEILFKAENEQAAVIYFMLKCYWEDKEAWQEVFRRKLLENFVPGNDRMTFGHLHHAGKVSSLISVLVRKREGIDNFEPFQIKAIFKRPYVIEEGIFFENDADATKKLVQDLDAGSVFDASVGMSYTDFIALLDKRNESLAPTVPTR